MSEPFKNAAGIAERLRDLRMEREEEMARLHDHVHALKDKSMRGTLIKDALYDALHATAPFKYIAALFKNWNR